MSTETSTIATASRKATSRDAERLTAVLTAAFHDDPVFSWCIPDDEQRRQRLPGFFRVVVDSLATHDETYCDLDASAAALWVPPGAPALTEDQDARLAAELDRFAAADAARVVELTELMAECHPHRPHWYLWFLAVAPRRQGRGLGSALLRQATGRCDRDGVPAYVEATCPRNRALYERHGFHVTGELAVAGAPPLFAMWREPGAG